MRLYTVNEGSNTHVFTSRPDAQRFIDNASSIGAASPVLGPIQEHDIAVEVAVCVEGGLVTSAVATGNVSFEVYDCDGLDIAVDGVDAKDGSPVQSVGEKAKEEFEALASSPQYMEIY